jgi:hypothetical protein
MSAVGGEGVAIEHACEAVNWSGCDPLTDVSGRSVLSASRSLLGRERMSCSSRRHRDDYQSGVAAAPINEPLFARSVGNT